MILAKELFTVFKAAESSLSLLPPNRGAFAAKRNTHKCLHVFQEISGRSKVLSISSEALWPSQFTFIEKIPPVLHLTVTP